MYDLSELEGCRDNELQKDLMIEVFCHEQGIVFAFFYEYGFCPVGNDHGKGQRAKQDDNKAGEGKKLNKFERFDAVNIA